MRLTAILLMSFLLAGCDDELKTSPRLYYFREGRKADGWKKEKNNDRSVHSPEHQDAHKP